MDVVEVLKDQLYRDISVELVKQNLLRLYAPFFHEDGDMYSIYLQAESNGFSIRDMGNTLMRLSYTFDVDTDNKQKVLCDIVKSNGGELIDGELCLHSDERHIAQSVLQYSQLVAKVSNMDILRREFVKSLFYEYLNDFAMSAFSEMGIQDKIMPTADKELVVDYAIPTKRPLYLFGVKDDTKAAKTVISCLSFQKLRLPFRSVIIHEDSDALSRFNRNQLMNAADKQFPSLEDFKADGIAYIQRELAS